MRTLTAMHWGVYEAEVEDGRPVLRSFREDPSPSPIGLDALSPDVARLRVRRPAFRKSWLDHGPGGHTDRRGSDPFVELDWEEASKRVADELTQLRLIDGERLRATLCERRVTVVEEVGDVTEEQRGREGRR